MKRWAIRLGFAGLLVGIACLWLRNSRPTEVSDTHRGAPTVAGKASGTIVETTPPGSASNELLGEQILQGFGTTNSSPENDLTLLARLMNNSLLLVKSAAHRPLSANEDWASLFRGQNPARERFLPDDHPALNTRAQLVDRWSTPLFFHALGAGRFEIRSAGPDRKLWTPDDIHRNADGSFRRNLALDHPSLVDAANPQPARTGP